MPLTAASLQATNAAARLIMPPTPMAVSDTFVVYPLQLPTPIPTAINEINLPSKQTDNCWFTIDGRNLGTTKPTTPGLYINGNQKIIITPLH